MVLNRPLNVRLQQVWKQMGDSPCVRDDVIHLGGPCEGPLMALHDCAELSESDVPAGLFFSTDRAALAQLADQPERQIRFFAGFAGWGPGQLEGELGEQSWLTMPAAAAHVFDSEIDLWDKVTRELKGREILGAGHSRNAGRFAIELIAQSYDCAESADVPRRPIFPRSTSAVIRQSAKKLRHGLPNAVGLLPSNTKWPIHAHPYPTTGNNSNNHHVCVASAVTNSANTVSVPTTCKPRLSGCS
ncbi:MAG: YqgE/AlgH family protein [Pirellulales bacterium]